MVIMLSDHLLRGAGLHAGRAGDHFSSDLGDDGDVGGVGERRAVIAGDGRGVRAAGAGIGHGGDDIRGAARRGKPDHHVFAGGAAAGDVALAQFFGVFIDFHGGGQSLGAAGHDVLHLSGSGGISGRTFGGVEGGDAAAGSGTDINQSASVAEAACYLSR